MPTGYTSDLYEGKPLTFEEFALQCARAFGATIMQRDDDRDAPLRLPKPHTDYHDKAIVTARERLDKFLGMPHELAEVEAEASYLNALKVWREHEQEKRDREGRYRDMIAQVTGWRPPTDDHVSMKAFMIKQLEESIDFDCSSYPPPERLTGEEYRALQVQMAERDLEYHPQKIAEEIERTNGRRAWITALADSLGIEVVDDEVLW